MLERKGAVTFQGNPLTLVGDEVHVGKPSPEATLLTNDLKPFSLSSLRGKVVLLLSVPSLDTSVCDLEIRRFNQEAAALGADVRVLCISMDLPFAQARWCGAAGISQVTTLSDHRDASFGSAFGVLIRELRLLARGVWVLDREGVVRYAELVKEVTREPNYTAALGVVKGLLR